MGDAMDNRRKYRRVKIKQTISVADEESLLLAEIDDITVGGISVKSEGNMSTGARFYVVFPGAGDIKENEILAEVLRCEKLETDSNFKYQVRAKFIDPNQKYVEDAIAIVKS